MPVNKRWNFRQSDHEKAGMLFRSLNIHPALCSILVQRGIGSFEEARSYFRPSLDELHDPFLMKDMEAAVARVLRAFSSGEKILVYGDYDVDGTTAVACMYRFLRRHHELVDFYIPHRYREGYGISMAGISYAHENGFSLVISLDCGIKSVELISHAKDLGIDFIVCDHHYPDAELPPAVAILNPRQQDCNYPYRELCGCGVGFKLITALCHRLKLPESTPLEYLDLVATAIAADIVPMTGENRVLAYHGLKKANSRPNHGIKALSFLSNITGELHINSLVFLIAPRVNAAGRMDDARKAVLMFVAEDYEDALQWAEQLHADNSTRKEADSSITEEALAMICADQEMANRKSTVLYQPHWHKGVVGIVASRLIDHYYRPTIILTRSGDYVAGSARSVSGFNVYEALHACREYLLGYGGHFYAAGMTLEAEKVDAFSRRFEEVVSQSILPEHLVPEIVVDAEINLSDIREPFYRIICQMEPFGPENLRPVFVARNIKDTGWSRIVKELHLRLVVQQDGCRISGIGFGLAEKFPLVSSGNPFDIVFTIDENEWNGEKNLQLKVLDLRLTEFQ